MALRPVEQMRRRDKTFSLFMTLTSASPFAQHNSVHCLGYLDESTLATAYSLADVLILPSLQETVGLPIARNSAAAQAGTSGLDRISGG